MSDLASYFNKFTKLIKDQMEYGAVKYGHSNEKEATDVIFDNFSVTFIYSTMAKYCLRYKNVKREKDTLKTATYSFLLWLKRGFHLDSHRGNSSPLDTTVDVKLKYFPIFLTNITEDSFESYLIKKEVEFKDLNYSKYVFDILVNLNKASWFCLDQNTLHNIFLASFFEWKNNFGSNPGQDTDTKNDQK